MPRAALFAVALLLAACPQDEKGILLQFPLIDDAVTTCEPSESTRYLAKEAYTVRLSFLRRKGKAPAVDPVTGPGLGSYELVCDRVFAPLAPGSAVDVVVPNDVGTKLTVRVEAFFDQGGSPTLEYAGQAEDLELGQVDGNVYLRPVAGVRNHGGPSCAPEPEAPRAFHSATALPNGGVLIAGGLVADKNGAGASSTIDLTPPAQLYTTGSLEIYEPLSQRFLVVNGALARRRAFHQAFLLPSPPAGPYQILLLGGVTAKAGSPAIEAGVWIRQAEIARPFLFSPHDTTEPAEAELLTYTPGAKGTPGSLTTKTLPELPRAYFPNAASANGLGLIGLGGGAAYTSAYKGGSLVDDRGFPQPDVKPYFINLQKPTEKPSYRGEVLPSLVGAAIAQLDDTSFLLVGGNMTNGNTETGEKVPAAGVSGAIAPFKEGGLTAWHTLTPVGDALNPAVLWAGGYLLDDDVSPATQRIARTLPRGADLKSKPDNLAAKALQFVDKNLVLRDVDTGATGSFSPAGYHEALRLGDGTVLLVGGNSGACGEKPFCPSAQLVAYRWDTATLAPKLSSSSALKIPRLGHRVTRLVDGTVMVTGGITLIKDPKDSTKTVEGITRVAEIYSLRSGKPEDDLTFARLPGKDSGSKRCKLRDEIPKP